MPAKDDGPDALAQWVSAYAADAASEENVDEFVGHVDRAILDLIPEIAADPVLVSELHASTRAQFKAFLNLLDHDRQEVVLPPQAVDLALSIARRNMELGVLLKVYRIALDAVWGFFIQVTDSVPEDGPDRADVLIYLWGRGGTWINEAIDHLIGVFNAERESVMRGALARRTETVRALLRGDDLALEVASADLGHQLRAVQTGLVLWTDDQPVDESLAALSGLATSIAKTAGAGVPLTMTSGRHELWVWLATKSDPDLTGLDELVRSAGLCASVGRAGRGIAGFRQSHREAVDAQRAAVTGTGTGPVTRYADVELAALLSGNPDAARALVERELGALATDESLDRVRETLQRYLQYGANVDATAAELIVHKNTVRYRLAQAEEVIGHPLTERRTEMDLALRYLQLHPKD